MNSIVILFFDRSSRYPGFKPHAYNEHYSSNDRKYNQYRQGCSQEDKQPLERYRQGMQTLGERIGCRVSSGPLLLFLDINNA